MAKSVKDMVDSITTGDLSAANDAFDAILTAKREGEWANAKQDFARTAFEPVAEPTANPGTDTGITGDPAEVEEEE
jgi:hypothetical protein